MKLKTLAVSFAVLGVCVASAKLAHADEASLSAEELNIYSPALTQGERELESRAFVTKGHQQGYAFSVGYTPTSYCAAEAYEVLHRDPGGALVADVIELESRFQLSTPGELWADLGAGVEWEIPQQAGNPGSARLAALLEKQVGRTVVSLNLPIEWKFGPNYVPGTGLSYGARAEYLLHPLFSPAVEALGEPGVIGRFAATSQQTHTAGPAIYGAAHIAAHQTLRYSVASLFGLTPASPGWTLVTRLELEF